MINNLVIIDGVDISPNVKKYSIKPDKNYKSWEDGNNVEHRIYTRTRLTGSFEVWLCGVGDYLSLDDFLELWNGAVNNNVITLGLYDQTSNSVKAVNAYFDILPSSHRELSEGLYFDVLKIEVDEK